MDYDELSIRQSLNFDPDWIKLLEIPDVPMNSSADESTYIQTANSFSKSSVKTEVVNEESGHQLSELSCTDDLQRVMQVLQKIVAADAIRNKFSVANLEAVNCLTSLLDLFLMKLCRCIGLLYDRSLQQNNSFDSVDHVLFDVVEKAFKIVGVGDFQTLMREFNRRKFEDLCEGITPGSSKVKQELLGQEAEQSHDNLS